MKGKRSVLMRCISLVLTASFFFVLVSVSYASVITENSQQAAFDALPEDAIVCYLRGQPVYKYEIQDNHRIVKESTIVSRSLGVDSPLPVTHRGEIVSATVLTVTIGYNQLESIDYLPNQYAESVAAGFANNLSLASILSGLISLAGGAIPSFASTIISGILSIAGLSKSQLANEIRQITDRGGDVILTYVGTPYGNYYAVEEWDGINCVRYPAPSLDSQTINVECAHGYPWTS